MTKKSILDDVAQAGWNPFNPSPECRTATWRPAMSDRLAPLDVMGIHWGLVTLQLFSRFARGKAWSLERAQQLRGIAVLFVLKQVKLQGELTSAPLQLVVGTDLVDQPDP